LEVGLSATWLQGEAEDERAVAAAQEEAVGGVDREVALLHTRLRLLAHHALVRPAPSPSQPLLLTAFATMHCCQLCNACI